MKEKQLNAQDLSQRIPVHPFKEQKLPIVAPGGKMIEMKNPMANIPLNLYMDLTSSRKTIKGQKLLVKRAKQRYAEKVEQLAAWLKKDGIDTETDKSEEFEYFDSQQLKIRKPVN